MLLGSQKTWLSQNWKSFSLGTVIFEDKLFTKTNAKNLLLEQKIVLNDPFEIKENKSMSGIGDYYNTFTLKISNKDRLRLITEIAASEGFKKVNKIQGDITQQTDRYTGNRITQNYETEEQFIKEYFEPNGNDNTRRFLTVPMILSHASLLNKSRNLKKSGLGSVNSQ